MDTIDTIVNIDTVVFLFHSEKSYIRKICSESLVYYRCYWYYCFYCYHGYYGFHLSFWKIRFYEDLFRIFGLLMLMPLDTMGFMDATVTMDTMVFICHSEIPKLWNRISRILLFQLYLINYIKKLHKISISND